MKKPLLILGVAILVIGVTAAVLLTGRETGSAPSDSELTSKQQTTQNEVAPQPENTAQSQSNTMSVAIENYAFMPASLTVKKGTKVTWTNKDTAAHTVTKQGDAGPSSGTLQQGESYTYSFDAVGTYSYFCGFHPSMKASVTVVD